MNTNNLEKEESNSSSAGSTSEAKHSGEGYSADCSASDQDSNTSPDEGSSKKSGKSPPVGTRRIDQDQFLKGKRVYPDDYFEGIGVKNVQINGVRIQNPMDPRIDLSQVHEKETNIVGEPQENRATNGTISMATPEEYQRLFESVKPFFARTTISTNHEDAQANSSSEGFTSFFATTTTNETSSSDDKKDTVKNASSLAVQVNPRERKQSNNRKVRIQEGNATRVVTASSNQNSSKSEENKGTSTGTNSSDSDQKNMAFDPVIDKDTDKNHLSHKRKNHAVSNSKEKPKRLKSRLKEMLRPGQPVSMEQALDFSDVPRIIVQSAPPFLVVHTNAALGRMTGIDSHYMVGHPIASIVNYHEKQNTTEKNENAETPRDAAQVTARRVVTIQRLIAASGFGRLHCVTLNASTNSLVGRNVTIFGNHDLTRQHSKSDVDSNDTSLSTYESGSKRILCVASISPIISTASAVGLRMVDASNDPRNPMRQPRLPSNTSFLNDMPVVTHYVLYLKNMEDTSHSGSLGSLSSSSASVEARLLGISKEQVMEQRRALDEMSPGDSSGLQGDENASDSTGSRDRILTAG